MTSSMTPPTNELLLEASGIGKSFPGVQALSGVDFDLRVGELHALVGENGAGKSTLARIVAGVETPDSGRMRLLGNAHAPASRREAERSGVRMVMQELNLIGNLTVAENIFIDQMPARFGVVDYGRMNAEAGVLMARFGLGELDPSRPVRTLSVGQQQLVEIAAGLSRECRLIVLDEPTASLTGAETDLLFTQIEKMLRRGPVGSRSLSGRRGVGVVYISHRMEEIKRIADRITVLRDGEVVGTRAADSVSLEEIIRMMVGREFDGAARGGERAKRGVALRVSGLSVSLKGGGAVRDVSFEVRSGEILGFAGLMGSGRTETMRAIFGADRPDSGEVYLHGSKVPARIRSPRDAVRAGVALLTEDRKGQGLLLPLPVRANVTMTDLGRLSRRSGVIDARKEARAAERLVETLSVRCSSVEQPVAELSGGNQQKVVVAKWIYRDCNVMIFDEPTRGIDVGAKFEIYRLLDDLAREGKAVVVVSSDLKELMAICDRIAVMSVGRLVTTFGRGEWSQDGIMAAALKGYAGDASDTKRVAG